MVTSPKEPARSLLKKAEELGLFHSARLKLDRAQKHAADARLEISTYLARNPAAVKAYRIHQNSDKLTVGEVTELVPATISIMIGDSVHNARSALDHAFYEMVGQKAKKEKNVRFPLLPSTTSGPSWQMAEIITSSSCAKPVNYREPYSEQKNEPVCGPRRMLTNIGINSVHLGVLRVRL
jgi:hypothetical protein